LDFHLFENLELIDFIAEGKLNDLHPELAAYRKRFSTMPGFPEVDARLMKYPFNADMAMLAAKPIKPVLTYFLIHGRGDAIRMLLHSA